MKQLYISILFITLLIPLGGLAQTDKAQADAAIHQLLTSKPLVENWHSPIDIEGKKLKKTNERGIWRVQGKCFQISSLRSDFYVTQSENGYQPVFNRKYPMESFVNLLQNRIIDNHHIVLLTHHQYGKVKKEIRIPMQILFDVFGRTMNLYSSVTSIDTLTTTAVLIFHHPKLNYIHMLDINTKTINIFENEGEITADFYTNIPQNNIKSLSKYEK